MASRLASSGSKYIQLLGIGTLSVKQYAGWVKCMSEGQTGKLKLYVANAVMNLWGYDLSQGWKTLIKIPPISETNHKECF